MIQYFNNGILQNTMNTYDGYMAIENFSKGYYYHGSPLSGQLYKETSYDIWGRLIERNTFVVKAGLIKNDYWIKTEEVVGQNIFTARRIYSMSESKWNDMLDEHDRYCPFETFVDSAFSHGRRLICDFIWSKKNSDAAVNISYRELRDSDNLILSNLVRDARDALFGSLQTVDLGLSVLWASKPISYKTYYSPEDIPKFQIKGWRIPSYSEIEELMTRCSWVYEKKYSRESFNVESNACSGGYIQIPFNGSRSFGDVVHESDYEGSDAVGCYLFGDERNSSVLRICYDGANRISVCDTKPGEQYSVILVKDS